MSNDWTHNENVRRLKSIRYTFSLVGFTLNPLCVVCPKDPSNHMQLRRTRRSCIPDKPNYSLNLWSIMKNCIGKDLSKIPMPVKKSAQDCECR